MTTQAPPMPAPSFQCPYCPRAPFKKKKGLAGHVQFIHPEHRPPKKERLGPCPDCDTKQKELDRLKADLAKPPAAETADLKSFIAHCEGGKCASHGQEWQATKAKIIQAAIDGLPSDWIEAKAAELGFIPQRIRVVV